MDNAIKDQLRQIFPHIDDKTIEHYLNEAKRSAVDHGNLANILSLCIDLVLSNQSKNTHHAKPAEEVIFVGSRSVVPKTKPNNFVVYIEDEEQETTTHTTISINNQSNLNRAPVDSTSASESVTNSEIMSQSELNGGNFINPVFHFVTQMFPNVSSIEVREMIRDGKCLDDIVSHVLNHPEIRTPGDGDAEPSPDPPKLQNEKEINYYTDYSSFVSQLYEVQCLALLKNDFRKVYAADIRKAMAKFKYHYAPTRKFLEDSLLAMGCSVDGSNISPAMPILTSSPVSLNSSHFVIMQFLARNRNPVQVPSVLDKELAKEVDFVKKQKTMKEETKSMIYAQHLNEQQYIDEGQLIECGCCFGEFPFEEVVQCSDAHLFCCQCLQSYAKEVIFGSAIGTAMLHCMTEDCTKPFPYSQLRKALSEEEIAKYQDRLQEDCLIKVDLPNLIQCPHCEFKAIVPEGEKVFTCLKPTCRKVTCKDCHEDWKDHFGLKCSEVEKKSQTNLRLSYEERMTMAKVRKCPKCSCAFTKSEGCNKMTCRCGTTMCYVCRKPQINYGHFCRHPRDPGQKCTKCIACSLWSDPKEDDDMAIKQLEEEAKAEKHKLDESLSQQLPKKQKV